MAILGNFTVFGMGQLEKEFKKLKDFPKDVDKALYAEAQAIFKRSQRLVPVDKGFLKNSGVVELPKNNEVLIGYGGPAASYALFVHENMEAKHKAGKQAKFLETPFMEAMPGFAERLVARIEGKYDPKKNGAAESTES